MNKTSNSIFMPGRAFFITSLFYLLLGGFAFFFDFIFVIWILIGAGSVLFIISDLVLLLSAGDRLKSERIIPSSLAQGEPTQVKIIISRSGPLLLFFMKLYDLYPESMSTSAFPAKLDRRSLKANGSIVFEYSLLPNTRGPFYFPGIEFMLCSPLHFWRLRVTHNTISYGRTYPNFKQMARGVDIRGNPEKGEEKQIRKRGDGLQFESLRDYNEGDSIRLVDWRATSRNRTLDGRPKLIVRNYQEEQDQQILFIIDSGYRLPEFHFDSALKAMLLLSYVALKHGDSVAAASFGARDLWIPPRKGISAYTGLMNGLYDLHSAPVPSSPFSAMEKALSHLNKRSFIILISNFREEDGESLSWILPRINQRHLLLMVSFYEDSLYEILGKDNIPKTDDDILKKAAAYSYMANRRRLYKKWEHSGLLVLETSPKHISSALVNKYLNVKKSGKL
ncbi:MAG: DUF58 domain-containing protein [Treponema sp.]|nr:DUF58 domain-containing protein [Treponema sp.]